MKRALSFILTAVMALSSLTAVRAEETEGVKKALATVKSRIGDTDGYESFESRLSGEGYYFSWDGEDKHLSVSCTEDGIITSYYKDDYSETYWYNERAAKFPSKSADEVKKIAEEFLKRINPDIASELLVTVDSYGAARGGYSIGVEQRSGGYKVLDSYGYISLNSRMDEVMSFWISYSKVTPPEKSTRLDKETAKQAFKEKIGLKLVYDSYYDDETEKNVYYPVYEYTDYSKKIDAVTGEVIDPYEERYNNKSDFSRQEEAAAGESALSDGGFSEAEISELDKIAGLISKDEAEKAIRSNKYIKVSGMELSSYHLTRLWSDENEYSYSMYFYGGDKGYAYVSIDAKTGEILYFYQSSDERSDRNTELEKEAAAALAGDKISEYRYDEEGGSYIRTANGIDVVDERISITAYGDTVSYYSIDYDKNAEFPPIDGAISAEAAAEAMFEMTDYEIYLYSDSEGNTKSFYELSDYFNINPFTKKPVNYRNEEITDENSGVFAYTDIENHWAKDRIETLAAYGIGFSDTKFRPDEVITAGDFKELLSNVFYYGSYTDFKSYFGRHNILIGEDFDDNSPLTRIEAAIIMVGAMGADEYADYDIYISPFADVTEYTGYAALLKAMGVVSGGADGKFRPNDSITRAEAAVMVYNYLSR